MPDLSAATLKALAGIFVLAGIVEGLIEYLVTPALEPLRRNGSRIRIANLDLHQLIARYAAAAVAIGLCFAYRADLLALFGLKGVPWVGYVVTGFLIGRGSNWLHDFVSRWLAPARS